MNSDRLLYFQRTVSLLNDSLCHLHHQLDVWNAYAKRMRALPDGHDLQGEAIFHEWLMRNYADSMAIGIRRVVFPGSGGAVCAIAMLKGLLKDKEGVTLQDAMAVYPIDDPWGLARHEEWLRKRFFLDQEQIRISRSAIGNDIAQLEREDTLARIKTWADKRVAHSVPTADVQSVAFDEVESALKVAGEFIYDYSVLLTGSGMTQYTPVIAEHWEGVLDRMLVGCATRDMGNTSARAHG